MGCAGLVSCDGGAAGARDVAPGHGLVKGIQNFPQKARRKGVPCVAIRVADSKREERGDGLTLVNAADGFSEQGGDSLHMDLGATGLGDRVGGDDLLDGG